MPNKFKIVWINLLMECEYDAEFKTEHAAEGWARRRNTGVINGLLREWRVDPVNKNP